MHCFSFSITIESTPTELMSSNSWKEEAQISKNTGGVYSRTSFHLQVSQFYASWASGAAVRAYSANAVVWAASMSEETSKNNPTLLTIWPGQWFATY